MVLRTTRMLTALAVIGLCGFTAVRGWSIVQFVAVRGSAQANGGDAARAWMNAPGLAGAARTAAIPQATDPRDIEAVRRRAEGLAAVLEVHPLSSADWLSLAGLRLVASESYDAVFAALKMSWTTGANEGAVMIERGTFGLLQWEILPSDACTRVIADLAGAIQAGAVVDEQVTSAKGVLASKADATRLEIAAMLRTDGLSPRELARLGL